MRSITIALTLTAAPALLAAQAATSADARAQVTANAAIPTDFSATAQAQLDAAFRDARAKRLPEQPLRDRIAAGRAKAASEARIVAEVQRLEAGLDASQQAMIRGGHGNVSDAEMIAGARAIERGVTSAQLTTLTRHAQRNRDLTVSLDVLGQLTTRGVPPAKAVTEVQAKLDARASDEAISSLTTSVGVGADAALGVKGIGATVGGTVGGVLGKRP